MYYFSKHVFCCVDADYAVFLDLRLDDYFCVPVSLLNAASAELKDWPYSSHDSGEQELTKGLATLQALERRNVLTTIADRGKAAVPLATFHAVRTDLSTVTARPRTTIKHVCQFVTSVFGAWLALKTQPIDHIVRDVSAFRTRFADGPQSDPAECARLALIFQHLRPYFPKKYRCLFDSLALMRFLEKNGNRAQWVFGVQISPFSAHCWVQTREVLLNDVVDHARPYRAIMVV